MQVVLHGKTELTEISPKYSLEPGPRKPGELIDVTVNCKSYDAKCAAAIIHLGSILKLEWNEVLRQENQPKQGGN